jgi:hypothetical protein
MRQTTDTAETGDHASHSAVHARRLVPLLERYEPNKRLPDLEQLRGVARRPVIDRGPVTYLPGV